MKTEEFYGHNPHLGDVFDVVIALGLDPAAGVYHHPTQVRLPVCLNRKIVTILILYHTVLLFTFIRSLTTSASLETSSL